MLHIFIDLGANDQHTHLQPVIITAATCYPALQRKDCKDRLAIYSTNNWELQSRTQVASMDASDLAWSPDSSKLAIWDSPLCYKVLVHAADGSSVGSYSAYNDGLGVRGVQWSPGGDLLAVGSYDQVCVATA